MALTQTLKIHGSGITTHPNGPDLNMTITLDNFYHNADNHIKFRIASASLVGGVASYPLDVVAWVALGSASGTQYSRTKLFSRTSYSSSAVSLASPIAVKLGLITISPVAAGIIALANLGCVGWYIFS